MIKRLALLAGLLSSLSLSATPVVNVYTWGGEIPKQVIQAFEAETGIHVNFSTYDSNETMFAKLKASSRPIYDVIVPSGYFVERMRKQNMLEKIDAQALPELVNLAGAFQSSDFDPGNQYSIPIIWGTTGLFYNQNNVRNPPSTWSGFWNSRWKNQLMLLDDSREIFAMALLSLGLDPNDTNPDHIRQAYEHLLKLVPNIKLFASESVQAIMIDEDASIGTAWSGDAIKAQAENKDIRFIFPKEGFVIWVDCLAIPKNPPHRREALRFINFILKPQSSATIALVEGHAITNAKGIELLPDAIKHDTTVYPPAEVLQRGHFQRDVGEDTLMLYNRYWEQFKLAM
ncbi:ABC transporter substrate-binding protein [Legionella sp. CNM-4043-24]|uniref:ABC transporter substrate-binding protein n=1 Tax=Legionella sp. CNM-4043-24 TaxID=3421646 RepID=UPI00403B0A57